MTGAVITEVIGTGVQQKVLDSSGNKNAPP